MTAARGERRTGIGLPSAAALVVASMIGSGVFTTSGFLLADLGRPAWVLLAWAVGGVIAFLGVVSYSALARRIPESGGEYTFLAATVHPLAGFLAGWVSLLAGFTAPIAVAALGLAAYLEPVVGLEVRAELIASGAILVACALHGLRLAGGVYVQNGAVALKAVLVVGLVVFGALRILGGDVQAVGSAPAADGGFPIGAFGAALVWISFSYSGWNAAVYVAGEVREPRRNVPRALLLGLLSVAALYLALNAVFLYAGPTAALAGRPDVGVVAAKALGGLWLQNAVALLVALALFTSVSSMVMAGPRVYARMAADGLFPRFFARGGETPAAAVALQGGLALLAVWVGTLAEWLRYVGFTLGLSTAATVAGLMWLRRREGAEALPVRGWPWVPLVFVLATLGASGFMVVREPAQALWGLVTLLAGLPIGAWFLARRG